jgi:hypothetical protein
LAPAEGLERRSKLWLDVLVQGLELAECEPLASVGTPVYLAFGSK